MFGWLQSRRRRRLIARGIPAPWRRTLRENVWHYSRLPDPLRRKLEAWVLVFVDERYWEGCGGLTLSDEMRVTVAGQAGLIVLGHEGWYFDRTPSILIYPSDYTARDVQRPAGGGLTLVGDEDRAGEAWYRGPIVLSWTDVISGGEGENGGHNLVIHEFAHQLDMIDDPSADGKPPMPDAATELLWDQVVPQEFERLCEECAHGMRPLLDCYGATNPAEFFAVASEVFFQRPAAMRTHKPRLYEALAAFYRLQPDDWGSPH